MAVETSLPKGAILICEMLLKVNYFSADKGKSLTCRVFIKSEVLLLCVYGEFLIIYFQMIFPQFFNTILFNKSLLI